MYNAIVIFDQINKEPVVFIHGTVVITFFDFGLAKILGRRGMLR